MERINVTLPDQTVARLDAVLEPMKRSQFLNYAALATLARVRGGHQATLEAVAYEHAARALVRE